ncbi:MAG: bactofilin family protein [Cellulosilyticaceae bacterium]
MGLGKKQKKNDEVQGGAVVVDKQSKVKKPEVQDTLIGASTMFTGDIQCEKSIRIDGKVIGNIHALHSIVIGETGCIKGDLHAEYIILYGKVEGNVEATSGFEMMKSGNLRGDVTTKSLSVQQGAVFCGQSKMKAEA